MALLNEAIGEERRGNAYHRKGVIRNMPMNWDAEQNMARDVEENEELYQALADDDVDDE